MCLAFGWTLKQLNEQPADFIDDCMILLEAQALSEKYRAPEGKPKNGR